MSRQAVSRIRWALLCLLLAGGVAVAADPALRSQAVYPRSSSRLRFSHDKHTGVSCNKCHAGVARSVSPTDRNLPAEAACRGCHRQTRSKDSIKHSTAAGCRFCHVGYKGQGNPARPVFPAANLRFNHRLHLRRGATCKGCHGAANNPRLPAMNSCRGCHQRKGASRRCVVCHLANKDGRLITRFASGKLIPRGTLENDAHGPLFSRKHGAVARNKKRYCNSCHQPRHCLRCHAGTLRPMSIHSGNYTFRHALDARRNQPRCSSCHRSQSFCLGCHQRLGVGAETRGSGFRPDTVKRFHSAAFTSYVKGPGHHAYSARRNIRTCTSCHRESSCIRCHGTRRRGRGGLSPHGVGWRGSGKCRSLASRNQRVCIKCHGLGDQRTVCQ